MANIDNSIIKLNDSKGSFSIEELNTFKYKIRKIKKYKQITKYLGAFFVLLCIIVAFLIISENIPFEDIL